MSILFGIGGYHHYDQTDLRLYRSAVGDSSGRGSDRMADQPIAVRPEYRKPLAGRLTLVCIKCTRYGTFQGVDITAAGNAAVKAEWKQFGEEYICPPCAKKYGLCRPNSPSIST